MLGRLHFLHDIDFLQYLHGVQITIVPAALLSYEVDGSICCCACM